MKFLVGLAMFIVPGFSYAYTVYETDTSRPYEIVPIESAPPIQHSYLGTLDDYPVMYEVDSEEPFTFSASVSQPVNVTPQPITLLLIRKNDRGGGVAEVVRMTVDPADWDRKTDAKMGMTFLTSPVINESVEAGTYRIEVSSPDNVGQYLLTIGEVPTEPGYFAELGAIRQTQAYFGIGIFSMLKSSYVYYPIGILLLLFALYKTWSYRHLIRRDAA